MSANRDGAGRFGPGNKANPGGRPRTVRDFEALARDRSPQAIDRLMAIASGRGMPAVKALEIVLAYGYGRPMQNITANSKGGPLPPAFAGAARAQLEQALADAAPHSALEQALAPDDSGDAGVTETEGGA